MNKFSLKNRSFLPASMEKRRSVQGFMFLIPWLLGFLIFFFYPAIQSIWYAFSSSSPIDEIGSNIFAYLSKMFVGLKNFRYIWLENTLFTENLFDSIVTFLYTLPIVIFLSFVFSLVLNQNFRGRLFVRAIFFLPVIIASGVVMTYLNGDTNAQAMLETSGSSGMYTSFSFTDMLKNMGLPSAITTRLTSYISSIFSIVWSTGVQTILFLAGLQSISAQYYEVAEVEGATKWETFWYVTFPMMINVLILNIVYTCIDLFTSNTNVVMRQAYELIDKSSYNYASAIMWCYFVLLGAVIGIILFLLRKPIKQATY